MVFLTIDKHEKGNGSWLYGYFWRKTQIQITMNWERNFISSHSRGKKIAIKFSEEPVAVFIDEKETSLLSEASVYVQKYFTDV